MTEGRSCGRCNECCTHLSIKEIGKPKNVTCPAGSRDGCTAYAERPNSCRDFACFWLLGYGKPADRPDRSKLMVYPQKTKIGETMVVWETEPGGARTQKAQRLLKGLRRKKMGIYIKYQDGSLTIEGSAEFVAKGRQIVEKMDDDEQRQVRLRVIS